MVLKTFLLRPKRPTLTGDMFVLGSFLFVKTHEMSFVETVKKLSWDPGHEETVSCQGPVKTALGQLSKQSKPNLQTAFCLIRSYPPTSNSGKSKVYVSGFPSKYVNSPPGDSKAYGLFNPWSFHQHSTRFLVRLHAKTFWMADKSW